MAINVTVRRMSSVLSVDPSHPGVGRRRGEVAGSSVAFVVDFPVADLVLTGVVPAPGNKPRNGEGQNEKASGSTAAVRHGSLLGRRAPLLPSPNHA